ncbi:MAG: hypothetical protein ACREES_05360 [Stellaceae bacterium]
MPMPNCLFHGNIEPSIDELLRDPIAQLLRNRDRIEVDDVLVTVERAKAALRHRCLTRGCAGAVA